MKKKLVIIFLIALTLGSLAFWADQRGFFFIKQVAVFTHQKTYEKQLEVLKELIQEKTKNQKIWKVSKEELALEIKKNPWVGDIFISLRYPASVEARVVFRKGEWVLNSEKGLYYLDHKGEAFKKIVKGDSIDLPLLSGIKRNSNETQFKQATEITQCLDKSVGITRDQINELHFDSSKGWTGYLETKNFPLQVWFGAHGFQEKCVFLRKILLEADYREVPLARVDLLSQKKGVVKIYGAP